MRTIKFLLLLLIASPLAAQSLNEALNGNTALQANAQTEEQNQNTPLSAFGERDQVQAITVNRLPDIKLNEEILTKTVLTYEMPKNLTEENKWFLTGNTQKALEELSKLSEDPRAQAEIALINLQRRDYKKAQESLSNALKLAPHEPIYNLLQVWLYAAQNKVKEAQKTYDNMLFLTSDFEYLASGKLALAQAYFNKKDFKEAGTILQDIYSNDPYKISHAVYLIARIYLSNGNKKGAQTLFEQALEHDGSNYMPQLYLARTQYKLKQYIPSWQSYASLFILDGKNKEAKKYLQKLSKHIKGDAEDYLFYSRLNEMFIKNATPDENKPLKIGLYSAPNGTLTNITGFTFSTSSPYTIKDDKRGFVLKADAFVAKNIIFDKKDKGVHVQNKWGTYDFSTKNPFIINLEDKKLSMIIKDTKADNIFATNLGDKELIGSLLVIPNEEGMQLVNITSVEETVAPLLTTALHGVRDQAVLEAMAIATRTRLYNIVDLTSDFDFNIPDNVADFNFGGNNMVSFLARKAAETTKNQVLLNDGDELALAKTYKACGPVTEDGIKNTKKAFEFKPSALNIFKYMFSNPPADLLSAPQDPTQWSEIKWIYSIPIKDIQQRLKQNFNIGKLKYFEVADFSATGRILAIRFVGSKKTIELPFKEANFVLSAGTLRSDFFTFIPFKKEIMFIGSDTGSGSGICIEGAIGLARQQKDAKGILNYYYPSYKTGLWQQK